MSHDAGQSGGPGVDQDSALGVTLRITQADLPPLRGAARLGEFAVVYRAWRQHQGGGFGDQARHPHAWGVLVYVDGQLARIFSARGLPREFSTLDRLERWLRGQGFAYWWTRNDLEPLGLSAVGWDSEDRDDEALAHVAPGGLP